MEDRIQNHPDSEEAQEPSSSQVSLQTLTSAAQIARAEETSYSQLTKCSKTVSIFVSSLISVHLLMARAKSFGRLSENFKHMLSIHALNSVVISAIEKSINTWQELNYTITLREIAPKFWSCAKSATKSTQEQNFQTISASRNSTLRNWPLTTMMS